MSEPGRRVLLQVCPNDSPPFADICRYHAAAAGSLSWRAVTVMLEARAPESDPAFHYSRDDSASRDDFASRDDMAGELTTLMGGAQPALTLCHRYRAFRRLVDAGAPTGPIVIVAHEFGLLRRRRRRLALGWDRWRRRGRVRLAGVSDAVATELRAAVGDAVVLPNGIDLARADAVRLARPDAQRTLGLDPAAFNVGVVGRLHPKKEPLLAVDGFREAAPHIPDARLVFVGSGELEAQTRARAEGLPVTFSGFLAGAANLLAGLDLLLVPSTAKEAFGMVALEAMAAGVPVLCGPAPGPRFVAGSDARVFEPGNAAALARALIDARADHAAGALAEDGARGRARAAAEFSLAAGARRLAALVSDTDPGLPAAGS